MASSIMPIAALFLFLYAAASASVELPLPDIDSLAPAPSDDEMMLTTDYLDSFIITESIAEPPSDSPAPAPASAYDEEVLVIYNIPESIAEPPFPTSDSPAPAPAEDEVLPESSNSKDAGAADNRYLTAHMSAAANKVEQFLATEVDGMLKDPATLGSARDCLELCKEVYESGADSLKKGVQSIGNGDFIKANFDVSAFYTDIDTCNSECSIAEFEKFEKWAKGVADDCLDRISKHTNHV